MNILEKIYQRKAEIDKELEAHTLVPVNMSEIKRVGDNEFKHGDTVLSPKAVKTLLRNLNVREDLVNTVSTDKWDALQKALHVAQGEQTHYLHTKRNGSLVGVDFKKIKDVDKVVKRFNFDSEFAGIKNFIKYTAGFVYTDIDWNPSVGRVRARFQNTDKTFDVGLDDTWNGGMYFDFGIDDISVSPFFTRLICANGMVAESEGKRHHSHDLRSDPIKFINATRKIFNAEHNRYLMENVSRLRSCNVSVNEYYAGRNCLSEESIERSNESFKSRNETAVWDDTFLNEAYGEEVFKRPSQWKATANTNINAYDFFNHLTWHSTHGEGMGIEGYERDSLSQAASQLFIKNSDLTNQAPNPFAGVN